MKPYKPYKHVMGVEWPSFHRYQQERRAQESGAPPAAGAGKAWATAYRHGRGSEQEKQPRIPVDRRRYAPPPARPADPNSIFHVSAIWHFISQMRDTYAGDAFLVDTLTPPVRDRDEAAAEVINFLRIPYSDYQGYYFVDVVWTEVIGPFMANLEKGMNALKPMHLPETGAVRFELSPTNELVLIYQD